MCEFPKVKFAEEDAVAKVKLAEEEAAAKVKLAEEDAAAKAKLASTTGPVTLASSARAGLAVGVAGAIITQL